VYRPIPKAILSLRDKPIMTSEMQLCTKIMKVMKGRYLYWAEYYNPMFCFGDHVYFEICTVVNPLEGFETERPLSLTLTGNIF
jgi:hypothetical protein